ncbi:hypothetical protein F2Q69_00013889 [Brassica cretica]|uniref:Uncharacterized protein n=1 Tax=Brassica cretica TaxID=69181 RepID=A0A8S9R3J8_BRACR|nr:hypothetical protein F2Q69_00013889 [Brassica cretica]
MAIGPRTSQAQSLRSDQARAKARLLRSDRARAKVGHWSLRSDRGRAKLGRYSEIVEIQRYIASRPEASTSIDRGIKTPTDSNRRTSIDEATPTNRGHLVTKVTSDVSDVNNHGKEISDDTYATLVRQQCKLDCLGDRLHKIENTTATTNDKWRRGDEAMRDFTGIWFNKST